MNRSRNIKTIVSRDKGYDAAVQRGLRNGILCFRREYIGQTGVSGFFEYFGNGVKEIDLIN